MLDLWVDGHTIKSKLSQIFYCLKLYVCYRLSSSLSSLCGEVITEVQILSVLNFLVEMFINMLQETQGVCVVTFGENKNFPSFYTPRSGVEAPYNIESPVEAALLIEKLFELHLNSGILLAVPIPDAEAIEGKGKIYCRSTE